MKPNKQQSQERKREILKNVPKRDAKGQDSTKVHNTKGKNTHGRNPNFR